MKSRPILFSAPMVRAILGGIKTQTRRVMKDQLGMFTHVDCDESGRWHLWWDVCRSCGESDVWQEYQDIKCPYGQKGDQLWVRETFRKGPLGWRYRAESFAQESDMATWKPSIFMPREACRIELEITDVRAERLQDISKEDAIAEGIEHDLKGEDYFGGTWWKNYFIKRLVQKSVIRDDSPKYRRNFTINAWDDPIRSFNSLWESINGQGEWNKNPWVWVITFRQIVTKKETV